MSRKQLEAVLDFILNEADEGEFEVVKKAVIRRGRDRGAFAALGGTSSKTMARNVAQGIQKQMGASVDGIRETMRGFVADIIHKNAPEVGEAELQALLDAYINDPVSRVAAEEAQGGVAGAASKLPPEALLDMTRRFVEYSEGHMPPSRQQELWQANPRWQEAYWAAFPPALRALVKGYLDGRIDGETFSKALLSLLGL